VRPLDTQIGEAPLETRVPPAAAHTRSSAPASPPTTAHTRSSPSTPVWTRESDSRPGRGQFYDALWMPARKGPKSSRDPVPPPLHELESEVMEELWGSGEASVRAVMQALNGRSGKDRAYTTYMTIMARLHKKGLLVRRRDGKTDYYAPAYERDAYMSLRARAEVDDLVSQYGDLAHSHFVRQMAALDPARRRAVQRLARRP
jgi:predicted transcriptional regulator